jgi:ribosomal protein S18 acetylase RimI-like enzyme
MLKTRQHKCMNEGRLKETLIRKAVPEDAQAIAAILHSSFIEYESFYTPAAFATTISTPERIRERLSEGPIWIALQAGKVVGTVSAVIRGEALYIRGMAVGPETRGSGTGRALLDCAEKFAAQHELKALTLSTTPFLSRAIRLYESYGFHRNADGPHDLFGTPLFTMIKILKD